MTPDETYAHGRTPWLEGAIRLRSINGRTTVSIERNGEWVQVIEQFGSTISHITEPAEINDCICHGLRQPLTKG